ncbi:anthranilate phosphoribosyltransferase [bacterium BMS3Abin03]|jgi:anthranilate phosphoribosyltransferase|nr:anthranilate phosphoribosyltransferase [bacterium BMS3Abin03]MCG6961227.1 anthranilate phosphoribosyltransferase [bacterium BMS3Abin03]
MIKDKIEKIIASKNLSFEESFETMSHIMNGEVNNTHIAALLTALKCKGEHPDEVAGFAKAMREKSVKLDSSDIQNAIDVCGTGGDGSGTFNISTAAAFVIAGAGIPVAKHGNRSISSKCGSADVLSELGVNVNLSPEQSAKALKDVGVTFMFAPHYHPAMKFVAPVRKELAMKTVFNLLGPLTNPAGTKKQLIGTYNDSASELMSKALKHLEMEKVCLVCTENKHDEITLNGNTNVKEFSNGKEIKTYTINNESFGYPVVSHDEIKGDSSNQNADIITKLFTENKKSAAFFVVAANAAMGLYSAGVSEDLQECKNIAEDSILSGKAFQKLEQLKKFNS